MRNSEVVEPRDEYNQLLEMRVRPPNWRNPTPAGRYNLVVIGAGTAGLVTAAGAAGLGAKVALVERHLLGGDCLNVGCVPSKGLLSTARVARTVHGSGKFGVRGEGRATVDFPHVMQRMRKLRAEISKNDSAERFRQLGVDVFLGDAKFISPTAVDVGGQTLHFKRAVVATGSRPAVPPIDGLNDVDFLTNESLFTLTELPQRMAVLGAGPIGTEMAQAFALFGSELFLIDKGHGILHREEPDAAEIVKQSLLDDGVQLLCCGKQMAIRRQSNGQILIVLESHEEHFELTVDKLLVATGRQPNVEHLGLEAAQVEFDTKRGIEVNDRLQTTNSNIYAAGDVCSKYQFTHAADFMARIVIQNSLFYGRRKLSALTIPWATYTAPELAHVGIYPHEAEEQGIELSTFTQDFSEVDRAVLDGQTRGFVRIHTAAGSDRILGATIVAEHAGDMIGEVSLAMTHGLGLKKIADAIHPYPTQAEAIRKIGDQYNRTRLTPLRKTWLSRWLAWRR